MRVLLSAVDTQKAWFALQKTDPLQTSQKFHSKITTALEDLRWNDGGRINKTEFSLTMVDFDLLNVQGHCIGVGIRDDEAILLNMNCMSIKFALCMEGKHKINDTSARGLIN